MGNSGTLSNGWHNGGAHAAFVGQNSKQLTWGATTSRPPIERFPGDPRSLAETNDPEERQQMLGANQLRREISGDLFEQLQAYIADMDYVVIYVGAGGSEAAIQLAAKHVPTNKLIFVMCDCNWSYKCDLIGNSGFQSARVIECECGGRGTMWKLFNNFMQSGDPLNA